MFKNVALLIFIDTTELNIEIYRYFIKCFTARSEETTTISKISLLLLKQQKNKRKITAF